ncbi:hypothetical protein GW7_17183 [Heterocephalus glaber]|uniref:Uncharacterized protein n=1 Tax=Heterocephalus glaber TaxID=10181 RepID=G5BG41_HETGA|nr:hypothetical protein GW7_17183 [Heterocephalus glaber]
MFKHVLSDEAGFEACFVSPVFPFWASPQRSALCPLTQPNFTGLRLVLATLMQDERKASCPLAAQATQRYWLWGAGPLTEGAPGLAIAAWLHLAEPPSPNQQSGAGGSRAWRCITPRRLAAPRRTPLAKPAVGCWRLPGVALHHPAARLAATFDMLGSAAAATLQVVSPAPRPQALRWSRSRRHVEGSRARLGLRSAGCLCPIRGLEVRCRGRARKPVQVPGEPGRETEDSPSGPQPHLELLELVWRGFSHLPPLHGVRRILCMTVEQDHTHWSDTGSTHLHQCGQPWSLFHQDFGHGGWK